MNEFLLPLKVAGEGSAAVESFASFFARLAYAHSISRSQLTRLLAQRYANQHGGAPEICEAPVYATHGAGLLGYRESTEAYINLVEDACSAVNLRRTTLIPIRESLGRQCIGSVKSSRYWCDACWDDDLRVQALPYDRFLWSLAPVHRCHLHRLKLRSLCPNCGLGQKFHHKSGHPGLCVKCGYSLIGSASVRIPALHPDFGEADSLELASAISSGKLLKVQPDSLQIFETYLETLVSPVAEIVRGVSRPSGTARAENRLVLPSLTTLLKKSFAAGVGAVDILSDPIQAGKVAGQLFYDRNQIPEEMRKNYSEKVRLGVLEALLDRLGKPKTEQIPALKSLARELGVPCNYIRRRFPELVGQYVSHRRAANLDAVRNKSAVAERELLSLINSGAIGAFARLKHVERHLVEVSGCTVRQARWVIKAVRKRGLEDFART